jgi:signal transduction histidine kinase
MDEFANQYATALADYLAGAGETALRRAYELGRQALEYESGVLVVAEAHHKALHEILLRKKTKKELAQMISGPAADFYSECLSPFEMAQRGYQESISSLRKLNEALQRQERDLRLLLSPMPNLLLTVDDHDCLAAFFVPPNFPRILKGYEVGMPLARVLPDEIETHVMTALPEVRQSATDYRIECPLTIDGQTVYFELQISPVTDSRDVLLVVDNITERKEIEVAEHKQRILAEALRDTAIALNSSLDLNEILNHIVASIGRVVPHDTANIMLIERDVARIVRSFDYGEQSLGEFERSITELHISPDKTPTLHKVVEGKQSVIVSDLQAYTEQYGYTGLGRAGSALCAPILIAGEVIGLINLNSLKSGFFILAHIENLNIFANQAAVAIQNARLYEQAQEAAALNERQRLARDLHDAVSQSLFSATIIAEALPRLWEQHPDKVFANLHQLHQLTRSAAAEMRVLLWELRPANLVSTGLDKLLAELISAVQARRKMAIERTVEGTQQLPPDVHIAFFRIAQECLNNIVKHSQATEAHIHLHTDAQQTIMRIRDNGQGFDQDKISSGFGMDTMRERAQMIGASLQVASEQGRGTEITVTWQHSETNNAK